MAQPTFPRSARLTKPTEFKRVFRQPITSNDRYFRVLARRGEAPCSRLGLAVSRQVDRKACGRNRIKRVVRESFRHYFAPGGPPAGVAADIVVLPRPESATISNARLFASLEKHWARIMAQVAATAARP